MSSIIEGYNYDIFISYRQKDNKGDRWVSEFVDALNTELESTFKEEVSVYFDINPHDGLLETHDVDASLKEKLKCFIFIPIISRTYCDPKSFAWVHEFKAFVEMASKDQFGLKVKLPNGNVASRVLPVRIHDLDSGDIKECEMLLGSVLRGIEFIYKEPGVNKPLTLNLNNNRYTIQINKVANSIKEIISGLKYTPKPGDEPGDDLISAVLNPEIKTSEDSEKSIAVIPFINDSADNENVYFINGLFDEIITNLQTIKSFSRVLPRQSVEKYRYTKKSIPEIAHDLAVNYIVSGSGQKYGYSFRLRITLTDTHNKVLWSHTYEGMINEEIFKTHSKIAKAIATSLKTMISPEEKKIIEKKPAFNLTAYDFYWQGKEEYTKYWLNGDRNALQKAGLCFQNSLNYDSSLAIAYTGLARVNYEKNLNESYYSEKFLDSLLILCNTAISLDDRLSEAYTIKGDYYREKGNYDKSDEEYDRALRINPNSWDAYFGKGRLFTSTDQIKMIANFEKAAILNHGPELPKILSDLLIAYVYSGFRNKALPLAERIFELTKDSMMYLSNLYDLEYFFDLSKALEIADRIYMLDSVTLDTKQTGGRVSSPGITFCCFAGIGNDVLGRKENALKYFKKAIEISREHPEIPLQPGSEHRIGYAYWVIGEREKAESFVKTALDNSLKQIQLGRVLSLVLYSYYDIAADYAFLGQKEKAYEYLRKFNKKQTMSYEAFYLMSIDPLFQNIRSETEFQMILNDVESKCLTEHERVKKWLEENKML